ncbi:MAG TPA: carbohydrate ABC transporter permease [Anaerolineales bacterium]|nr:carbohydrate ABC transporter permease [Anaerolineales bacterium]
MINFLTYLLLGLGAAIVLVPFWWMVKTSLTAQTRLFEFPPQFFPDPAVWRNYIEAWNALPVSFTRFTANTIFITVLAMTAEIFTCSLVAYGFARFRFPGRNFLFLLMLSTMMLPGVVTLVPSFILWRELKLIDTYDPMTLGAWFAWGPSYIFLLRQFFLTLPKEIEEAARIDGANTFQIYWHIMLPLVKPALLAIAVLSFIGNWNNFMGPLIYLNSGEKYPLIMALKFFEQSLSKEAPLFHYMMAMTTMMSLPLLMLYFFMQRTLIEGITAGAVKG